MTFYTLFNHKSNGEKWFKRRKLITPAFHFDILKDFLIVFNEQADMFIENLKRFDKKTVCLLPYISACALDIICGKKFFYLFVLITLKILGLVNYTLRNSDGSKCKCSERFEF